MAWNALVERILAGSKREKEIEVENQSDYDRWLSELHSEIAVFVERVNALDLEEAEHRKKFYEFISRFSDRLKDLRERSEASAAPTEDLIRLEELIEVMNKSSSSKAHVSVSYLGDSPFEKAKHEEKKEKRRQERIAQLREKRDEIGDQIQEVSEAFEEEDS
jgi:DNA repair exonuclease SbcCD ATPase subunit